MSAKPTLLARLLDWIERNGNRLPDPAILFFVLMLLIWIVSAVAAPIPLAEIDPRTGEPLQIQSQLTGPRLAEFLSSMVTVFINFAPLGVVLVAMLGVGVAEHSGYIHVGLRKLLHVTPQRLLTPMLIVVAIVSHSAVDAGYVLVVPLGGVIFYAAGRHPLAGIAAAFAGVSGGFSANFVPSSLDPLLQSFTMTAAQILDPEIRLNPLNNYYFTSISSLLIVGLGWFITDRIVEPRLKGVAVDGDPADLPVMEEVSAGESRAFWIASCAALLGLVLMAIWASPADSALRDDQGSLSSFTAPMMKSIVPLIFLLTLLPGVVFGYLSGTFASSKDLIQTMAKAMHGMAYYIVMAFFCALFIDAFGKSNLGALMAIKGAGFLQQLALPGGVTILGIILLTGFVNLFVGSASAKWALISPIFVPMLMELGISPDLTQAAYRVGDSSTNIITPLMPYFPLVVVFCQRYVKATGIGTVVSMMLPFSIAFLVLWSLFLLVYWAAGVPLGLQANYVYPFP
jgi:para-aminobenzoyl-glutamate transporter family